MTVRVHGLLLGWPGNELSSAKTRLRDFENLEEIGDGAEWFGRRDTLRSQFRSYGSTKSG
jgi:hypothetical protein